MISRGIGDVRRVLGQPQSWIDQTFPKPAPPLPDPRGDALLDFVCCRLRDWEQQVTVEAAEYRNEKALGAAMVRYATNIRRQCAAIRLILARYGEARDSGAPELAALRTTLEDLATSWETDPRWREDW